MRRLQENGARLCLRQVTFCKTFYAPPFPPTGNVLPATVHRWHVGTTAPDKNYTYRQRQLVSRYRLRINSQSHTFRLYRASYRCVDLAPGSGFCSVWLRWSDKRRTFWFCELGTKKGHFYAFKVFGTGMWWWIIEYIL